MSQPVIPDYNGPNVRGLIPGLLAPRKEQRPAWFPERARHADQVVLLVLDGLGWEQLHERPGVAPTLQSAAGGAIQTVAPSTTATALTSLTTGLTPGEHGIVGYRMEVAGEVLNTLRWTTSRGDARAAMDPARLQPFAPFLGRAIPVVGKADLQRSAFSEAHLRGAQPNGWRVPSNLAVIVAELVRAGEPLVYAYYDGIDKVAHEFGFGPYYDAELRFADGLVAALRHHLPAEVALIITADHGQVDVGQRLVAPGAAVQRLVRGQSGEGRFRWLHAKPGSAAALLDVAREAHAADAWVMSRDEVLGAGWLGPVVSPPVAARLGDVALVAHRPVSFVDPADSGPIPLVCRHGSLTSAEMLVPLLAID